jgi:AcrR family transcriptional regulator
MSKMGRRPGPSDTRGEILRAAAAAFTDYGYEATTLRGVAADAGVDPALIRRFFRDKERLFTEVVASVVRPDQALEAALQGPRGRLGERLARYFLGQLGDVRQPGLLLGLIRSAVTSEHAATLMRRFVGREILGRIATELDLQQADLRAALVGSQLVGLAVTRYAVQLDALVATDADDLVAWVAPTLQRYLTGAGPRGGNAAHGPELESREGEVLSPSGNDGHAVS